MDIFDFSLSSATLETSSANVLVEFAKIAKGQDEVDVTALHMTPGNPTERSVFGEEVSTRDHFLVVLSGSGLVSGGTIVRQRVRAGQCVYFPKREGYLVFAEKLLTALLVETTDLTILQKGNHPVQASR